MLRVFAHQILFFVFFTQSILAQVELYVHQPNCENKTVVNIANNPQYKPQKVDEETQLFIVDSPEEPKELVFIIDSIGMLIEKFWIEPSSKRIDFYLYNCRQYGFYVENPNELTREARAGNYYVKYLMEKSRNREEFTRLYNEYEIDFIKNNPDSYLSLVAFQRLSISDDEKKELFKLIGDNNKKYPLYNKLLRKINSDVRLDSLNLNLKFQNIDKDTVRFNSFKNKSVVFVFWMSGCKWSIKLLPDIIALDKNYEDIAFVYYCLDRNLDQWKNSSAKFDIPKQYNISELDGLLGELPMLLDITTTPSFIVVNKNQEIVLITYGDELFWVEEEIKSLH